MPEDMKEMYKQRQRELAEERAQMAADLKEEQEQNGETPTTPKTDELGLPPPPKVDQVEPTRNNPEPKKAEPVAPKAEPTAPATRPREVEKKKGKKGDGEP